jgi:hypothetical protein
MRAHPQMTNWPVFWMNTDEKSLIPQFSGTGLSDKAYQTLSIVQNMRTSRNILFPYVFIQQCVFILLSHD